MLNIKREVLKFFKQSKCLINNKNKSITTIITSITSFISSCCDDDNFSFGINKTVNGVKVDYVLNNSYLFFIITGSQLVSNIAFDKRLEGYKKVFYVVQYNDKVIIQIFKGD